MVVHQPVMLAATIESLGCAPGKTFVDATVGGGGHAEAILKCSSPDGRLVGLDWDEYALEQARQRLASFGKRVVLVRENFAHLPRVLSSFGIRQVDGILLDLGLSAYHLEVDGRGFSFITSGPLDMRMDNRQTTTAADLVNELDEAALADLLRRYGEERWAGRIARALVRARAQAAITTTDRLAAIVSEAIPASRRPRRRHPATQTFQALRVAVNKELDNLEAFLACGLDCLRPEGRLVIISYHSLEDRAVKQTFAGWARACTCPPRQPICTCGGTAKARLLAKRPVLPSASEVEQNPRARSARLRVVEKL